MEKNLLKQILNLRNTPESQSNCLNCTNCATTIKELVRGLDDELRSLHAGCRRFKSCIAHFSFAAIFIGRKTERTTSVVFFYLIFIYDVFYKKRPKITAFFIE